MKRIVLGVQKAKLSNRNPQSALWCTPLTIMSTLQSSWSLFFFDVHLADISCRTVGTLKTIIRTFLKTFRRHLKPFPFYRRVVNASILIPEFIARSISLRLRRVAGFAFEKGSHLTAV